MKSNFRCIGSTVLMLCVATVLLSSQTPGHRDRSFASGDTPDVAGPLATDLSPAMTPEAVADAMRKVGDWELGHSQQNFSQDWTFAALYRGYVTASATLHDDRYRDAMMAVGKKYDWQLGSRQTHADDQAIGTMYLDLYRETHEAKMLEPTKKEMDRWIALPDVCSESCPPWKQPSSPLWWWCDSLFMAPPVLADLASITGDKKYLDRMDKGWWATSKLLYAPEEHLYARDASYLDKHETNGKRIFWSRGNGWVIAGLTEVLDEMPKDFPSRAKYVEQFRQMASALKAVQRSDGLWGPGLLNGESYPLPEVSGSAFFVYAMAWGIDRGVLDRATYLPVVERGWAGLVSHIYADGRLGSIQPIGGGPDSYKPQTSYVFGVGAFLMAGSELRELAERKH
ncbi:MAG TPA: glycoside hydrolase family 88 protein [Terracidiphilus sp.]|nr:glycoside hydrolase family 88 protein [Terracidiphilus sp.]